MRSRLTAASGMARKGRCAWAWFSKEECPRRALLPSERGAGTTDCRWAMVQLLNLRSFMKALPF